MKLGDWIIGPLGEEFRCEYLHPYKDEVLLLGMGGWMRWMPIYYIESHWKKVSK